MIICCGEALIDMIPETTVSGRDAFVPHTGGAVFNTAIALGRLGVPAGMLTGLSSDMFGGQLRDALHASSVDASHVVTSGRPTTLAFVQIEDGQASYSFYDENSAGRMLTPTDMPILQDDASTLYFGGISLACEPGADAYASLLARESKARVVMIDPNIRPSFIKDEARYRLRLNQMMAEADIVKVSDEDLNWIIGTETTLADKAEKLLEMGPMLVIVTRGGDGATAYLAGGESVHVPSEKVEIVDTVGAGDTFNAGVLGSFSQAGLLQKNKLPEMDVDAVTEALKFGAKVAAVTVARSGANPPWIGEL
jgi:fructokinase